MKASPRRVLALWRNNSEWRASLQDIRAALGSAKAQMPKLKSLLDDLVVQNSLSYERHRYQLVRRPAPAPGGKADRKVPPDTSGLCGVFSAHPDGYGFVAVEQSEQSVFIPPRKDGGALDGDTVRLVMEQRKGSGRTSGKIVSVEKRGRSILRGFVHEERRESWLLPLNEKLPMVYLEPGEGEVSYSRGDLVEVTFASYPTDSRTAPTGHVLRVMPSPDGLEQIVDNILADLQIPVEFPAQIDEEMRRLKTPAGVAGGGGREDLSHLTFVTIDGEDARDFDDAVCLSSQGKGEWKLHVAIADVAEFVHPGSAVDEEALLRGTSVYFPERVIPMLPEKLSNDLCSLKPEVARLTMVCEMTLDAKGRRTAYRIYEAVIRSHARLTYGQVQRFFDEESAAALGKGAPYAQMLGDMLKLSRILAANRAERGALGFEFPEARFIFSAPGVPDAIDLALPTEGTRLIEQFMLEANETVAWHCETNDIPILYRVHDPPPAEQLALLRIQLLNFGVTMTDKEFNAPEAINSLLLRIADHPAKEEMGLLILKSMAQAQYRGKNDGHYGLAAEHYAHFTSPIRRYPDLLVHRALKQAAAGNRESITLPPGAGMALSTRERTAAQAESRVSKLYRVLYMEKFLAQEFSVMVSGISARGLWIRPRDHFAEGLLPMALLPDNQYRYDAQRGVLRAARGKRTIAFGQRLTAQLIRADRMTQELEFSFVAWDWRDEEQAGPPKN